MDINSEITNMTAKEIYESDELTKEEKIVKLKQCEYHVRQLAVADYENMGGPQKLNLPEIQQYLELLDADDSISGSTPTMLGA